jgi:hypothetical protein
MGKTQTNQGDANAKSSKKRKQEILPTLDEQRQLNQVEFIVKHNFISLQVAEMITEIKPAKGYKSKSLNSFIEKVIDTIKDKTKRFKNKDIDIAWLKKQAIDQIPIVNYGSGDVKIKFEPSESVDVIGSVQLQTMTNPISNVDIAVTIPSTCFDDK